MNSKHELSSGKLSLVDTSLLHVLDKAFSHLPRFNLKTLLKIVYILQDSYIRRAPTAPLKNAMSLFKVLSPMQLGTIK